jgi:predicted DCC family thiol-disulfide oxidoreductase YuxK
LTSQDTDILLIDGHCGLCSRFGSFINKRLSPSSKLKIIAQEEIEGIEIISKLPKLIQEIDSVILIRNDVVYYYSPAGIRCLLYLKWWWKMWYPIMWVIPLPIRNLVYTVVSKNRKNIFKN